MGKGESAKETENIAEYEKGTVRREENLLLSPL